MTEKDVEQNLKPLPSIKVTEGVTPKNVIETLKEVEKTFARVKKISAVHKMALKEAEKGNFEIADEIENVAQKISKAGRKSPLYKKDH